MSIKNVSVGTPTANLAINKSRIKMYGKKKSIPTYYLEKGQEFQIELYNPTQEKVLTTIKLNNKAIKGGLILRPGERVFLDRYLDSNKRFLFDTYKVENSKSSRKAIEPNGDIEIAFFKEVLTDGIYTVYNVSSGTANLNYNQFNLTQDIFLPTRGGVADDVRCFSGPIDDTTTLGLGDITLTTNSVGTTTTDGIVSEQKSSFISAGVPTKEKDLSRSKSLKSKRSVKAVPDTIETGRVEQGSTSDQNLCEGTGDFEMMSFHVVRYKLLPKSQKKLSTKEYYTKYCGDCGAKCKTKFCPYCGAKQ